MPYYHSLRMHKNPVAEIRLYIIYIGGGINEFNLRSGRSYGLR